MCLAVPGRVEQIEEAVAVVDVGGATVRARLDLVPDAEVGEWVLVHAGFAIEKVDEEYAKETLALLAEMDAMKGADGVGAGDPNYDGMGSACSAPTSAASAGEA